MTHAQNSLSERFSDAPSPAGGMTLHFARIIKTYPAQRTVDLVLKGGGVLRRVPVGAPVAGTHEGSSYLPDVDPGNEDAPLLAPTNKKDTYCVVGYIDGDFRKPVVLTMLFPDLFEASFEDGEVTKHRNGTYTVFDDDGFEMSRPDGTYIRIGASTTKKALAEENFDNETEPFKEDDGTANTVPHIYLKHSSGLIIDITPAGSISITKAGGGTFALESHVHSGVTAGGALTGVPQ